MVWACVTKRRWQLGQEMYETWSRGSQTKRKTKEALESEVMEKDCQAHKLNKEDAMDGSRWRKTIKDVWRSGWVWVGELVLAHSGSPGQRTVKRLTVVPMMKLTWSDYTFVLPSVMSLPLTISCFSKIQICFTFLVPAHPGSPGQGAVKRLCVCDLHHFTVASEWEF